MGNFDCMFDEETNHRIQIMSMKVPHNRRREFKDEALSELYDFMPFERREINEIIKRVYLRYTAG
jgi:hypothetical protein